MTPRREAMNPIGTELSSRNEYDNVVKTIQEPDNGSSRSLWEKYTLLTRRKHGIHKGLSVRLVDTTVQGEAVQKCAVESPT